MFNVIPIKILMTFITEIEKSTLKVHLDVLNTTNNQGNTKQKRATSKVSQYLTSNYTTEP
jgi:hypothetical protein